MDEAPEPNTGESPYLKLPWPLVAGGLLAVLLLALGAGLYANRYLRPPLGPAATITPAALAAAPPTSAKPAAPLTPTLAAAASTATSTAVSQPSATPTLLPPTQTPMPPATTTPPPRATVEPSLAAEVGRAYEKFWRVRSQAVLQLDATQLQEVMDGEYLAQTEKTIEDLRGQGKAIKTMAALNYNVIAADQTTATVTDRVEDNSYYVKAGTEDRLTDPVVDVLLIKVQMEKKSGVWKVVDSVIAP